MTALPLSSAGRQPLAPQPSPHVLDDAPALGTTCDLSAGAMFVSTAATDAIQGGPQQHDRIFTVPLRPHGHEQIIAHKRGA